MPFNPLATTYRRVIPRDLFNEADLLKCYGRLWVCLDNLPRSGWHTARLGDHNSDHDGAPFRIGQDQASGALTVENVPFTIGGRPYRLTRAFNSREPWPLYATDEDDEETPVFDAKGILTPAFRRLIRAR